MAKTITASVNFNILSGGSVIGQVSAGVNETPAGTNALVEQQSVGTGSWAALNVGLCSPADWIAVLNTDPTNYVQVALANDGTKIFGKLKAGRPMILPQDPTATFYVKANTAACVLLVGAAEA